MRELTGHKVNGVNDGLTITVLDEPGIGGANHRYRIQWLHNNVPHFYDLDFQNGPIKTVGTNGITHEALLAILIDRLEGFQRGKFACDANERALRWLLAAQDTLLDRTKERQQRGVEGTHTV
jgi:hypothetical protein